jgi:ABC-2 type transport system permease protein
VRNFRLVLLHAYYETLELLRQPSYVVSTIIFPAMFFWFFGVPNAQNEAAARLLTASFSAFGLLGVVLFQFAVSTAEMRATPWEAFLQILPLSTGVRIAARLISGAFFALLSIGGVLAVSYASTTAALPLEMVLKLFGALLLAALPFGLVGLTIGLSARGKSVLPIANMVYLPLSFAGGLWLPPNALPKVIQDISPYLPTRYLGELVWAVTENRAPKTGTEIGLLVYTLVFAMIATMLFRRELEKSYR